MGQEDQDVLLRRFLNEEDPTIAQVCLEGLLAEHVEPVVRDITRYKVRSAYSLGCGHEAQDEEDIRSEVVLQLISRLRDLRKSPTHAPIENFRAYVAATTYNAYYQYVRMKYPVRWRLKNRLRYLLNHRTDFAIWKGRHQEYFCGLAAWAKDQVDHDADPQNQPPNVDDFIDSLAPGHSVAHLNLPELAHAVLAWNGRPVLLDELVGIVADLQGTRDVQPAQSYVEGESEGTAVNVCDLLPDLAPDVLRSLEQRSDVERLWNEICQLPQRQRVALLLNLRDSHARDALVLFSVIGIANLRQIAEVMEMPLERVAACWNMLPLEDSVIAELLGITRQQVINLRKSARERLARRMAVS
jgi:DNA-directed RNA polymerase specialized sigma24 family protein